MGIYGVMMGAAIVAVALLGMVSLFQGVMTSQRAQTVLNTMNTIETTTRRTFANLPNFEAGTALQNIAISAVPTGAVQSNADGTNVRIVTPWGGNIVVGAGDTPVAPVTGTSPAGHPNRFYIVVEGLPDAACETVASAYLNRSDVVGIDADGAWGAVTGPGDNSVADIVTYCDDADDNDIAVVFRG